MKTKYLLPFALGALLAVSCNKAEIDNPSEPVNNGDQLMELKAEIINSKTTYDDTGKFSWVASDKITVVVYNDGTTDASKLNVFDHYSFDNKTGDGTVATFEGSAVNAPWHEYGVALYPNVNVSSNNCLKEGGKYDTGFQIIVNQEITPSLNNPLEVVPLIGRKNAQGIYQFKTAMGILKVTVANIPADAYYLYLQDPNGTFAFSGTYDVGDQDEIRAQDAVSPGGNNFKKTIAFTPQSAGETRTFFFPLPTGTIPAGTQLKLDKGSSGSFANIMTKTFTKPITIQAGHVKPLAAVSAVPMDDVLGTYTMTVTSGSYSSNNKAGMLVIEESDDPSKGNIMITKFADIEGKQYGTFDGDQLVFPADQLFAANPYSNAADYPYIALDAYTGGVTDALFDVLAPGHLQYVGDDIGFRATTDDLWYNQSHNGAWPWSLGFGSLEATRVSEVPLTAAMINVNVDAGTRDGSSHYDGIGKTALVDNDFSSSSFWHSPWLSSSEAVDYYGDAGTWGAMMPGITDPADVYDYQDLDPTYGVFIDINLSEALSHFYLRFCLRDHSDNHAKHVLVYGSTDGIHWGSALAEVLNVCSGISKGEWINFIDCQSSSPVSKIRLSIIENTSNVDLRDPSAQGCVHMAELKLYKED